MLNQNRVDLGIAERVMLSEMGYKVVLDDKEVPPDRLYVRKIIRGKQPQVGNDGRGVLVDPGDHRIRYAFKPATSWILLNVVSWITLGIWTLIMGFICARRCSQCFRRSVVVGVGCMRQKTLDGRR
jgi:hypothetical protein